MKLQAIFLAFIFLIALTVETETTANNTTEHSTNVTDKTSQNEAMIESTDHQQAGHATTTTIAATHQNTTSSTSTPSAHVAPDEPAHTPSDESVEILDEAQPHQAQSNFDLLGQHDKLSQKLLENIGILSKQQKEQEFKIEEAEHEFEQQEEKKQEEQLDPWLEQQRKETEQATKEESTGGQSFQFSLPPGGFMSLFYDANNNKPGNDIHLDVWVYIEQNNSFYIPNRPVEYSGVSLTIVNQNAKILLQKKIYVSRSFEFRPPRNSGYYFNYMNNYASTVLVVTNAQRLNKTVDQLNSTHLDPLSNTLKGVFDKMQKSFGEELKYSYKSEIGFRQREDQHQSTMLMLTGIELLTIILTTVIQMYCLRNLLDNRSIV